MHKLALGLALSLVVGCGGFEITSQPLAGKVGGQSWTFVSGDTNDFLSDESRFFATLYAEAITPCGFGGGSGNHLILSIPTAVGQYDLSLSLNMTFVDNSSQTSENLIGTDGTLRVDEITADTIIGGIHAKFDDDNEVDGEFTISICPPSN